MTHDQLARSLADHLRGPDRMVWCDLQLGPSGSPRPDVFAIYKSFVRPSPLAYECKVSTADFRSDVTSGKWQSYLAYASGVYFACEAGLITKGDVPEHCGLIVLTNGSWRAARKATLAPVTIPQNAFLKLLIDGVEREGPIYRARHWSSSVSQQRIALKFGDVAARVLRDRLAVEHEIEDRQRQAEGILQDARRRAESIRAEAVKDLAPLRAELCGALGLPADADIWLLQQAVRDFTRAAAEHPAHEQLRRFTQAVSRAVDSFGFKDAAMAQAGERDE